MTFGINGAELIILIILAVMVLGPEKLPEYTRKLTEWIRNLRRMAEGAKVQFRDETGTDFDEIDWRRYDPRQYDPRRIIRDALTDPVDDAASGANDSEPDTGSAAAQISSGTRETLRKDLGAVRSQRDALREDLKDMDPRALFFGSSRTRRDPSQTAGNAPTGAGSSARRSDDALGSDDARGTDDGAQTAGPTPAGARALPAAGSAMAVAATATDGDRAEVVTPQDGPDGAGTDSPCPAPFDTEAT